MANGQTEWIPDGTRVRILRSGYGPGPQAGGAPPTGKKDGDDVVDAEFEVK